MKKNQTKSADYAKKIRQEFTGTHSSRFRGEYSLEVKIEDLRKVLEFCQTNLQLDFLLDITSVDNRGEDPRFWLVYELTNAENPAHLRIKAPLTEDQAESGTAKSVCDLWATADWHEREIYDMMGIRFSGHPDLRRILMWEGYPFHPLRKEFPLAGKTSDLPDVAFTHPAPLAGGPFVEKRA